MQPTATLKSRTRRAEMGVRGLSLEGGRRGQERTEFENTGAAMVFANADDLLVHIPPIGVSNVVDDG